MPQTDDRQTDRAIGIGRLCSSIVGPKKNQNLNHGLSNSLIVLMSNERTTISVLMTMMMMLL